jgi:amidohydrolase
MRDYASKKNQNVGKPSATSVWKSDRRFSAILRRGFRDALIAIAALGSPVTIVFASQPPPAAQPRSHISAALASKVNAEVDSNTAQLEAIFKDIHQHPELGFDETRTAGIVAEQLKRLGFEVKTGIGKTGVVGILKNGPGPTVMYRADMDANAVEEKTGLPYESKVRVQRADGTEVAVAHMCGHDAHVTWMLGVAKVMVSLKSDWSGTLIRVGQPAEEPITGAAAMIEDGMYTKYDVPKPDYLIALHTAPIPTGSMGARAGTIMAGTDQIDVTFHGVGAHGAMPQLSKDPIIMGTMAVVEYQMIVSRVLNPLDTAVLTVGSFQAGADNNVIPDSALLKINLRFFDLKVREQMIDGIRRIDNGIAITYGMPADQMPTMVMKGHSPPLVNDAALITRITPSLQSLLGEKAIVTEFPATTGSEDAHLLKGEDIDVPLAYMFVGIADPEVYAQALKEGKPAPFAAHGSHYIVDLKAIPLGAKIGTTAVLELLAK